MLTFKVKVQGQVFLWGGRGVKLGVRSPFFLHLRVDEHGDAIEVGVIESNGQQRQHAILQPGEAFLVKLDSILGVYASIGEPLDCNVECAILIPQD